MDHLSKKRELTYSQRLNSFSDFVGRKEDNEKSKKSTRRHKNVRQNTLLDKHLKALTTTTSAIVKNGINISSISENNSRLLLAKHSAKHGVPHRLLVTGPDSISEKNECESHYVPNNKVDIKNGKSLTDLTNISSDCKQIKAGSINEIRHILQKFPMPKGTLHNFYQALAEQFKDKSLEVEPMYESIQRKKRTVAWVCSYRIKWPLNAKIIAQELTKKEASYVAAGKALDLLVECRQISQGGLPLGLPLVYTNEKVKTLGVQKQPKIDLDKSFIKNMENMVEVSRKNTSSISMNNRLLLANYSVTHSVQHRLLVTRPDSVLEKNELNSPNKPDIMDNLSTKNECETHNVSNNDVNIKNGNVITDLPTISPDCKQIKVDSINEIRHILQKFPMPKSTLHNFYQVLSEQFNDKSLKIEPMYKSTQQKKGSAAWVCSYHIKWPVNAKIVAQELTKKQASSVAAGKALDLLVESGKISQDGLPLVWTNEEVKKLGKQKQTKIDLDKFVIKNMENIIEVFNDKMKPVIESTEFNNKYLGDCSTDVTQEPGSVNFFMTKPPKFLGNAKYFAKEKNILPISSYKDSFIELLQNNNCVIVKGETGCGKSSRVPQYVLESWIREVSTAEDFCRIAVTQPRRIAAISLSNRVSSERNEELGHIVGYQVRLKSNFQTRTGRILYCTTGILLRHLQSDQNLSKFSHVILDEAHERDVNTDLLMNLLKRALKDNNNLKLVVMSATIDTAAFSEYFDGAPVFSVPGFTYPVEKYFLEELNENFSKTLKMCKLDNPQVIHEDVVKAIYSIHKNKPEGAILVFLPGWEDLAKVRNLIGLHNDSVVHLVHSKLKDSEQNKIFSRPPPGIRKIILATNIAETSITIDDVVYVVDTGIHKDKIFEFDKGINVIDMEWISKASANQRAGRAGRCSPGESYHLYSRERYEKFSEYSSPKILNSSLTKIVLDSKVFTNNMDACEFMDSLITPPERTAVEKAVAELKQLELLDENEKLTPLGRALVNFQLEPCLAKAMVNGVIFKCVTPIIDIVTLFSSDTEIFGSLSLTDKESVKRVKSQFCKTSDHLALMRVYEKWLELKEEGDNYAADRFCRDTNLVPYKLEFVNKLKDVHLGYLHNGLYESMPASDDFSDNDELVKAVLYSGTGTVLEHRNWDIVKNRLKTNVNVLVTRNNHKATITSESVNYKRHRFPSNFLVYINETRSNIRRTTIVRECSLIPAISVLLFNNNKLELIEPDSKNSMSDNLVIIGIKNTKIQFLCDREDAIVLIDCKQAIDSSYKYLIHQLTFAGENIPGFIQNWDQVLGNLSAILDKIKVA